MKKVFFLIAFLFTVVCYAAPPPDNPVSFLTEDVGVFRSQGDIAVQVLEVQEVTFSFIGNKSNPSRVINFNKPRYDYRFISRLHDWKINKQNSNFAYPFGADY